MDVTNVYKMFTVISTGEYHALYCYGSDFCDITCGVWSETQITFFAQHFYGSPQSLILSRELRLNFGLAEEHKVVFIIFSNLTETGLRIFYFDCNYHKMWPRIDLYWTSRYWNYKNYCYVCCALHAKNNTQNDAQWLSSVNSVRKIFAKQSTLTKDFEDRNPRWCDDNKESSTNIFNASTTN